MNVMKDTAVELGRKIKAKEVTVKEVLDAAYAQIEKTEDQVHSYVTLNQEAAYAQAEKVQAEIDAGKLTGPLAGVPMAVKDNLCTKDLRTTCSSKILEKFTPTYTAQAVKQFEAAGAIILGKTNMDEFAMGSTTETSAYGITKNPWNTAHVPGGSSGGSCAAVAAGTCSYALGSDTGGSIRQPSSFCGVVGIKPTYGTVSRYGLVAYASSLDQIGPIAKDVTDCAAILELMSSYDKKDSTSIQRKDLDFTSALIDDVRGMKIGIPRDYFTEGLDPEVGKAVLDAAEILREKGAVVEEFDLGMVEYAIPAYYVIASAEASSNLARFDGVKYGYRSADYGGLHEMYKKTRSEGFGAEVKRRMMLGSFVLSEGYYDAYYLKALRTRTLIKQAFDQAFSKYDVILGPAAPTTAPEVGTLIQDPLTMYLSDIYTVAANLAGLPAMSVPCGMDAKGVPIGMQLIGDCFQEQKIIRTAYAYECSQTRMYSPCLADTGEEKGRIDKAADFLEKDCKGKSADLVEKSTITVESSWMKREQSAMETQKQTIGTVKSVIETDKYHAPATENISKGHKEYETVIGLEVHVELATKTKIFCACSTAFGGAPNTHTCPVCTGMPGSLPVLNKKVVEYAIAVGLATDCTITRQCQFDRKNYFYPDNPQNYQISQLYLPICRNGGIEIETTSGKKTIGIHEIHMEEDAGKLIHEEGAETSLVDYNRSGVPLIEIVSEPDMRSAEEVIAYLEKLKTVIQYLGASDCKLQEGSMRADVNLSVREVGAAEYGTRTEMKNINSFKAIARAIEAERARQIAVLEAGGKVVQETRRWDDNQGYSYPMRSKEDAQDYRYFPEPDLAPIRISDEWLDEIRARQPELRSEKLARYQTKYEIPDYDAQIITSYKKLADLFEETSKLCGKPKKVSNWIMGETMRLLKEQEAEPDEISFSPQHFADLIELVDAGTISTTVAKEVFEIVFAEDIDPAQYVEEKGLKTVNDEGALRRTIEQVLADHPQSVEDYHHGKEKAIGFLVGQTMKAMKGKADPGMVNQILKELL